MKIAFTICSNNYLAQAKTLGDSFLKYHPDVRFIIGLVDKFDTSFDYSFFLNFTIIPVEDLKIDCFNELNRKYNLVELNTAVKPDYFKYVFENFNAEKVLYIDPDILVKSTFEEVYTLLDTQNIILTPHICSPVDDDYQPTDYHTLRGGVFNLGFIALSNYNNIESFLNWWRDRVYKYGYANFSKNMFYDQLWINYVPVFYDNYYILKHPGYNMANWNLHERSLSAKKEAFYVNNNYPLRFFHFSSYKYDMPYQICSYLTRYDFNSRPDLIALFNEYNNLLLNNKIELISKLKLMYFLKPEDIKPIKKNQRKSITIKVISRIKKAFKILIYGKA